MPQSLLQEASSLARSRGDEAMCHKAANICVGLVIRANKKGCYLLVCVPFSIPRSVSPSGGIQIVQCCLDACANTPTPDHQRGSPVVFYQPHASGDAYRRRKRTVIPRNTGPIWRKCAHYEVANIKGCELTQAAR